MPRGTGEDEDLEFLEIGLILALKRYLLTDDPDILKMLPQWAAEVAALQEARRGLNDPG